MSETRRLTITRHFNAPRDLLWKVWTEPKHVAEWWGPFGPDETSCEIEAAIGGIFAVAMTAPDGSKHPGRGVIREFDPPEKLVIEGEANALDACGAGLPPRAIVTVTFKELNDGTELTLHAVFPSLEAREAAEKSGYATSWIKTLDALGPFLERFSVAQN